MNIDLGYAVILPFHDFHLRGQTNMACLFIQATYRNVMFRDYILTLALYTVYILEFEHVVSNLYS